MTISKYNLIRFILDEAYDDSENTAALGENFNERGILVTHWKNWFHKISRIYNHKIPQSLLDGLKRKNNTFLTEIILEYEIRQLQKPVKRTKEDEYDDWIKRVNTGNQNKREKAEA